MAKPRNSFNQLIGSVKAAIPFGIDTVEATVDMVKNAHLGLDPPPPKKPEEVQKLQTGGLLGLITLAAVARAMIGNAADALLLALLVLLYASAVAIGIWLVATGLNLGSIRFIPKHTPARILTNVIGAFVIGLLAFILTSALEIEFASDRIYADLGHLLTKFSGHSFSLTRDHDRIWVVSGLSSFACFLFCLARRKRSSYSPFDKILYAILVSVAFWAGAMLLGDPRFLS